MAAADVSRLVLQVDASVELARRNLAALAAAVEGDSQKMDRALKRVDDAHVRLGKSSGASRVAQMEFMHVITASTDALNAGMPISRVFAMEIGRIAEAAQFAAGSGGLGGFAKFLTGGWGIALQVGISLLTMLAMRHGSAGEAASEHKSAEEKLKDAVKAVADASKDLNANELVTVQRHIDAARAADMAAESTLKLAKARLQDALAQEQLKLDAAQGAHPGAGSDAALAAWRHQVGVVEDLKQQIGRFEMMVASTQRSAAEAELKFGHVIGGARSSAEGMAEFQANQRDILLDQDFRRRTAGRDITGADRSWLAQREAELATQREAGMRAAQAAAEAERRLSDNRAVGREITLSEAESIVRGIGGRVTPGGGFRSHEHQAQIYEDMLAGRHIGPVARPGTSAHERGQALDVAMGPGMSVGRIREAFRAEGVSLRKILPEPTQRVFHVEWGKAGPSEETLAHRASAAADRRRRDQEDFAGAQSQASQRLAAAQEEAARHSEDSLDLQIARIGTEKKGLDEATRRNAIEHHWSQAETNTVLELNRRWAQTKIATATARDEAQNARERLDVAQASLRTDTDVAHLQAQLADTAAQRKASALALLDLSQQQERNELEATLASKEASDAQKEIARNRLARLGELRSLSARVIDRENETPGQRFQRELGAKTINEQLGEVKVRGLQSLEDGLVAIVSGTESVSSAFKRMAQSIIADLARIAIEREIIQPLANALFGSGGGGGGGGGLGSLFALLGFGGGSGIGGGDFGGALKDIGNVKGFALGGDPPIGRASLVGERGPELIVPRSPMTVIPNHMLRGGGGGGGREVLEVHVFGTEDFDARVERKTVSTLGAAVPGISARAAHHVVRLLTRTGLNG